MRDKTRTFTRNQVVPVTMQSVKEDILLITEDKANRTIYVQTACYTSDGMEVGREDYLIAGDHYSMLMSESPDFAQGKPLNEYREIDLWYIIDLI